MEKIGVNHKSPPEALLVSTRVPPSAESTVLDTGSICEIPPPTPSLQLETKTSSDLLVFAQLFSEYYLAGYDVAPLNWHPILLSQNFRQPPITAGFSVLDFCYLYLMLIYRVQWVLARSTTKLSNNGAKPYGRLYWASITSGSVRHGCSVSPSLNFIIDDVLKDAPEGFSELDVEFLSGARLINMEHVDLTVLPRTYVKGIQTMLGKVSDRADLYGMRPASSKCEMPHQG
ncbi:uncharacterized protein DEA37_0006011 [Paragonimus westermani]|uniref:Uncharacterized protein n=1 Tax=Paragonimus westermani TaxID=34504 RepID=A0A5J4NUZ4_9TREM|nr:uncharacterized protein DEA37_0006011 [Paragonimus westermani]